MIRKSLVFMTVSIAALGLVGCGSESGNSDSGAKVKVDVGTSKPVELSSGKLNVDLYMAAISNEWQKSAVAGAKAQAKELGWDLNVYDATFDAAKQLNQIQNAVQRRKTDAMVIQPVDGNLLCKMATKTLPAENIPVVALGLPFCGHETDNGPDSYEPGLLSWVGSNPTSTFNTAWFDDAARLNPGKQTVALVQGPEIIGQAKALKAILKDWQAAHPDFDVKYSVYTDYTTPDALAKTQALLKASPDVSVIMSVYSPDLTRGIVQALQEAGKAGKIPVVDQGGSKYSYEQINAGVVQMTFPFFPNNLGKTAVNTIYKAQQGEKVPHFIDDSVVGTAEDPLAITKENMSEYTPEY